MTSLMESVQYLQQTSLPWEVKKFKFAANIEQTANNIYWFLHAHILIDLANLPITSVYGFC